MSSKSFQNASKLNGIVSVLQFGAVGDGVADDTAAIQAALNTGKSVHIPTGTYKVTNALNCVTKGQQIKGDGKWVSIISVPSSFNISALGVFVCSTGEEGPQWSDLKIAFFQPDTTNRLSLIQYPPAIYARNTPRFTVYNSSITNAMVGIDMKGNSGGAVIDFLEMSAYSIGIDIDGCFDVVRISKLHYWVFDQTPNQKSIFFDVNNIGIKSGRCDILSLVDCLFINGGKHLYFYRSAGGYTLGYIVNTDFDTYASVVIDDGVLNFANCFFTIADASYQAIKQTNGYTRVTASEFSCNTALNNPMIDINGGTLSYNSPVFQLSDSIFRITGDPKVIRSTSTLAISTLIVSNNQFNVEPNINASTPIVNVLTNSRITFTGNRFSDKGTGTGNALYVAQDEQHVISNNMFVGWGLSLPSPITATLAINNGAILGGDFINGFLAGNQKTKRLTSLLNVSGELVISHGIPLGNQKSLIAQAYYKGTGGTMLPLSVVYIDGADIKVTGGTSGAACRISLVYSETSQNW